MDHSYFISLLTNNKRPLLFAIVLMIIESLVSLSVPWFAGAFSQAILEDQALFGLSYVQLAVVWFLLFAFQAVLRFLSTFRVSFVGATMLTQLSCRLYDHIQILPVKYFNTKRKGEILSLLSNDVSIISYFLSGVITSLVPAFCLVLGSIILMFSINTTISLIIMCMVPAFFIILKLLGRGLTPLTKSIVEQQANAIAIASENFNVIKLVKAFNREGTESQRFKTNAYEIQQLRKKQLQAQAILSPLVQLLISSGVLVVILVCVMNYQSGQLTMSELITLLMYGMLFARPMSSLAHLYGQVQQAKGASTRIIEVFGLSPEPNNDAGLTDIGTVSEIRFEKVSFDYAQDNCHANIDSKINHRQPPTDLPLLNDVSFVLAPNSINVLIGENGQGKSTILHLLMQFIAPTQGTIYLDQYKLADINLATIRNNIGLVSQDVALCNGSVIENIAYGYPNATLEQVQQAAKSAGADDFINQLAAGYDTKVGENGVLLSGGQRQKISLARALLSDPKIFLLDEPTSMIDKESKADFQASLKQLFENKTVLIVTHDQDMQLIADQVIHLQHGKISTSTAI